MDQAIVLAASGSALVVPPRLSSRTIIFTNGPCLTLKSTLARMLSETLDVRVLATYQYGEVLTNGVLDEAKRLDRYEHLHADAELLLTAAHSVILDGSFGDHARRSHVYDLARRFRLRVIAIRTDCDDFDIIRARARRRAADPAAPDHAIDERFFRITQAEVNEHPIGNDAEFWELGGEIIEVHTGRRSCIMCRSDAGNDAQTIVSMFQACGLLTAHSLLASRACMSAEETPSPQQCRAITARQSR